MSERAEPELRRQTLTVVLGYAVFATLWIVGSDAWVALRTGEWTAHWIQTAKGLAFVAGTSAVLAWLIRRQARRTLLAHEQTLRTRRSRELAEARLALALEASRVAIYEIDVRTGQILFGSDGARALGLVVDDAESSFARLVERVHPDDRAIVSAAYAHASPETTTVRFRVRNDAGDWLWVEATGRIVAWGEDGEPLRRAGTFADISVAKASELAIQESEARYRAMFEQVSTPMFVIDPADGRIADANRAAAAYYGWSREQLLRMHIGEINTLPPETLATALQNALHSPQRFEFRHRLAEGTIRDVEVFTGHIPRDGRTFLYAFVHDVTARKTVERELARSERRNARLIELWSEAESLEEAEILRNAASAAGDLVESRCAALRLIGANERCEAEVWSRPSFGGGAPAPCVAELSVESVWAEALRSRGAARVNGEQASVAVVPVVDRGKVVLLLGVARMSWPYEEGELESLQLFAGEVWRLVARARTEAELRTLSSAVSQSGAAIMVTDAEARIRFVNDAFSATTGYSSDEIVGQSPRILGSSKTPRATYEQMWAALGRGAGWKGRLQNRKKDGTPYIALAHISPVRNLAGRTTHYVAVQEDITERVRLGEELDRHRFRLEELVAVRTGQLAKAMDEAKEANRAKSEFLANMSHEIRTPLNAVLGQLFLMRTEKIDDEQRPRLDGIESESRHLLAIIDDILDLSRIEAGRLVLAARPFDPNELAEQVREVVELDARRKGVALELDRDPSIPGVVGDETRCRQALLNFAANAVKFTSSGKIVIRSRLLHRDDTSVRWRLEVEDSGVGIDEATLGRLFRPFEQGDASTTRRHGGAGLGLAITRKLVEAMGGEVGVSSTPGVGSTFWLELTSSPSHEAGAPRAEVHDTSRLAGRRVLLVEDNLVNQAVAGELLRRVGLVVDVAGDGREAIEMARSTVYDAIVMDMQMPVLDGLEATRRIRQLPSSVPIVALTASAFVRDREACEAAGMNDFLSKPVDPGRLYAVLARWIAGGAGAPPTVRTELPRPPAGTIDWSALGVDARAALPRVGGDEARLLELLEHFAESSRSTLSSVTVAFLHHDLPEVRRLAHGLQGGAATLGLESVAVPARRLESAAKLGEADADALEELKRALERHADALPAPEPRVAEVQQAPPALAPEDARRALTRLASLLARGDTAVAAFVDGERDVLAGALGERWAELRVAVRTYDYERALALVSDPHRAR